MAKKADKKVLKEVASGLLGDGSSLRIPAEGYSMYPTIRPGNTILIEPINDPETLKPGDIMAWARDSDIIVHRLIRIAERKGEKRFVTCGDISLIPDKPISSARIVGRVEFKEVSGKLVELESFLPGNGKRKMNRAFAKILMIMNRIIRN